MAALLTCQRLQGVSPDTLSTVANLLLNRMRPLPVNPRHPLLDIVGTGGDGLRTFNVSTAAFLVAAGAGCRVAKHGNKAFSSKTGAADVLEALGVQTQLAPAASARLLEETGACFLLAPTFHPSLAYVADVRRALGFRTLFNLVGPLVHPAKARHRLIGANAPENARLLAKCVQRLDLDHCLVVHGTQGTNPHAPGLDELSTLGKNLCLQVKGKRSKEFFLRPSELGFKPAKLRDLQVDSAEASAAAVLSVFHGEAGPRRDLVLLNAGAALHVYGRADSIAEGVEAARDSIDSGRALEKLGQLQVKSHALA